jgi:hypothetical protein
VLPSYEGLAYHRTEIASRTVNPGKIIIASLLLASLMTGCMRGVFFSRSVYPSEASRRESPPPFMACISITTGLGKSYVEKAPKTIRIELFKAAALKTVSEFSLTAGDLDMETSWQGAGKPIVRLYGYPDDADPFKEGYKALRRLILTKRFRYNASTDVFDEVSGPSPAAVKANDRP